MTRFGADYHVARSSGRCSATGRVLESGETCVATLVERPEDDSLQRQDFSLEAWEGGARPQGLFSYWKTTVPQEDGKSGRLLVDDEVLLDLFHRLAEDARPQRIAFRFVLGLILMRKKRLKFVGRTQGQAGEMWQLRPRGDADEVADKTIELVNPNLSDDDVRELIEQLGEVLQTEL